MNLTKKIVCAISGGVDSCVAAYFLKQKGFNVHGAFMRNWDVAEEASDCNIDEDAADAAYICSKLNIPFHEVNFVREYWNEVFCELINGYTRGITPNPDVLCNQRIKFGHFFKHAIENMGADYLATGHYAKSSWGQFLQNINTQKGVNLLKPKDQFKDQTLFLSQISQHALSRSMFPIGGFLKSEVKKIAVDIGMDHIASKKESAGICFIGRRNFQDFMNDYIKPNPGVFIDLDSGRTVGKHQGVHLWTVGQRVLIGGLNIAYFVLQKITGTSDIYVVAGFDHPALYNDELLLSRPNWINQNPFIKLDQDGNTLVIRNSDLSNICPYKDVLLRRNISGSRPQLCDLTSSDSIFDKSKTQINSFSVDRHYALRCPNDVGSHSNSSRSNGVTLQTYSKRHSATSNSVDSSCGGDDSNAPTHEERAVHTPNTLEVINAKFRSQHPHTPVDCALFRLDGGLRVKLSKPMRAIAPGQYGVLYGGEVCLGSAQILRVVPDESVEDRIKEISRRR